MSTSKVNTGNSQDDAEIWNCRKCGAHGIVEYDETTTVGSVIGMVREDHAEKSPECAVSANSIRLRFEKRTD